MRLPVDFRHNLDGTILGETLGVSPTNGNIPLIEDKFLFETVIVRTGH
jgi:hypothetical protein